MDSIPHSEEEFEDSGEDDDNYEVKFRIVHVFDISQTDGDPIPDIIRANGDASMLLPAIESAIGENRIQVETVDDIPGNPSALGASYGGLIRVRSDLASANRFRTLVHEFAHEKRHWRKPGVSKTVNETEADATAFVVCRHFGMDCDTSDYLLLYDSSPQVLLERMEVIRFTACEIIRSIEAQLPTEEETEQYPMSWT